MSGEDRHDSLSSTGGPLHFYQILMERASKTPMALVDGVGRHLEHAETLSAIIRKYWSPRHDWDFYEYLGLSMTIIQEVAPPDIAEESAALFAYNRDRENVVKQWPDPKSLG